MKRLFLVGIILLIMAMIVFSYIYFTTHNSTYSLVRDVEFDSQNQRIILSESRGNENIFKENIPCRYSNPDLFSKDMNADDRFVVTTIIENSIPRIYVYDFDKRKRIKIEDEKLYKVMTEGLKQYTTLNYDYYWHPTENVLVVALRGLYYNSNLYVFKLNTSYNQLDLIKEVQFSDAVDKVPYGWIKPSNNTNISGNGFVVNVITKLENSTSSGAFKTVSSYFSIIHEDGSIE